MKIGLVDGISNGNNSNGLSITYRKNFIKYLKKKNIDYIIFNCCEDKNTFNKSDDINKYYSSNYFIDKFNNWNGTNIEECTHIIGLEQNTFSNRTTSYLNFLRKICRGYICHFCDFYNSSVNIVDILFYNIPHENPNNNKSLNILYGADQELLKPNKNENILEILIDHSNYGKGNVIDYSYEIIKNSFNYFKSYKKKFILRRFISNGIEIMDVNKPIIQDKYNRKGLPYDEACNIYNKSHVFIVTHPESLGYSIIECAMAGALIVTFDGFIKKKYLDNFHHIKFKNYSDMDWNKIIDNIDINKSRKMAEKFTWDNLFDKIIDRLNKNNYNYQLNLIFNNFDRNITIFSDDIELNKNLLNLNYKNIKNYNKYNYNNNEYKIYLFINPNDNIIINNNHIYYIIKNDKIVKTNKLDNIINIYYDNLLPKYTDYIIKNNENILIYKDFETKYLFSAGLKICPIFKYFINGKFMLSFDIKIINNNKIKIYNGKTWIIINKEFNNKYLNYKLEIDLFFDTNSKPRISINKALNNNILYIKNSIVKKL